MNKIQQQTNELAAKLAELVSLVDTYGSKIPDGIASVSVASNNSLINFSTGYSDDNRAEVLALCGDVFGRTGWIKELSYNRDYYHWTKTVNGVRLFIHDAEVIPTPEDKVSVPPNAFPLMLKNVEVEAA